MREVPPRFPWEIRQQSDRLIGTALACARPVCLSQGPNRLNGLSDDVVAERYDKLRVAVLRRADGVPGAVASFEAMEGDDPESGSGGWQALVDRVGAADDAAVIALAHEVWEALGPNEYAVQLRMRPRSQQGFVEGRAWLIVGAFGTACLVLMAGYLDREQGLAWWWWLPVILGWPALVLLLFDRRQRRLLRQGGKELPHL